MKYLSHIFSLVAVICLTFSCAKIEQTGGGMDKKLIRYDVVQDRSSATKAAGAYPSGETFAAYAWYLPEGMKWSTDKADAQLYINEAQVSYDGISNSWYDKTKTYYWPKTGALTFFSISPYSVASAVELTQNYGFWISDWNVHEHQDADIMVSDIQTDKNANETYGSFTGVPTVFRHKLSMIEGFTFNTFKEYAPGKTGSGYKKEDKRFFIEEIKINNLKQEGRFVSGNSPSSTNIGLWLVSGSSAENDYIWFSGNEEVDYNPSVPESIAPTGLSGNQNILVLPQTFADPGAADISTVPNIEITFTTWTYSDNSNHYTTHTTTARAPLYAVLQSVGNKMDMNKKIVFNITINLNSNLIIWAPDQNDWTGDDFNISI